MSRVASAEDQVAEDVKATGCAEDVEATCCAVVEVDESAIVNVDDSVECYVCERCVPPHLYRDWSDYTHCARSHLRLQPSDKHHFFKDQVRTVKALKSDPTRKTSPYMPVGTPTFKTYSVEEQRIFLRERIIRLGILKVIDRIDSQLVDGQPVMVAVVVLSSGRASATFWMEARSWAPPALLAIVAFATSY